MDGAYDFEFDCLVDPVSTEAIVALYEDPGDTMGSYGIGPILASPRLAARDLQRLGGLVGGKRPQSVRACVSLTITTLDLLQLAARALYA